MCPVPRDLAQGFPPELNPAFNVHVNRNMARLKRDSHYVDVIERVLAGVQVIVDDDPRSRAARVTSRPWLGGVVRSSVEVARGRKDHLPFRRRK